MFSKFQKTGQKAKKWLVTPIGFLMMAAFLGSPSLALAKDPIPSMVGPESFGTDIHFTGAPTAELDLLQKSGVKVVRLDFNWYRVETAKGKYDFSQYDGLITGLAKRGIRPYCLLGFGNQLYSETMSIHTQAGREAFARFAAAAAARYKNYKVIWEIWNEPNLDNFWLPKSNADEYMALVKTVSPAIRAANPNAIIVAPALANTVTNFMQTILKQGLSQWTDAISVHPYQRNKTPEGIIPEVALLRSWLQKYAPENPNIPIFFSEWGYSYEGQPGFNEEMQANYLGRQMLLGMMLKIPVNIWYDWKNDRPEPCVTSDKCYGMVKANLALRPAYTQMQRLASSLNGFRYIKRLPSADADYYLVFSNGGATKIVAWTTGTNHNSIKLPDGKTIPLSAKPTIQMSQVYIDK